jgi:hypothetical protein
MQLQIKPTLAYMCSSSQNKKMMIYLIIEAKAYTMSPRMSGT